MYLKHYKKVSGFHVTCLMDTYVQTLIKLLLLLVDYAKAEVNLVGLLKSGLHTHDLREGLFGMLQRAIAIIKYTNAVPKLGLLIQR
jgi:hypothetical protein